jgi:hypothetical protein
MSFGLSLAIPATVSTHRAAGDITNRAFGIGPPAAIPQPYKTGAVHFDGLTAYLRLESLTATDSSQLIYSYWFKDVVNLLNIGPVELISSDYNGTDAFHEVHDSGEPSSPKIFTTESTFTQELDFVNATGPCSAGVWHHALGALDVGFAAGARPHWLFVDDIDVTDDIIDVGIAFTLVANGLPFNLIGEIAGSPIPFLQTVEADIADFWWALNQFLDLSVVANRRKFISAAGKPVDLGATGSTPTGTAPTFFLRRAPGDAAALFANDRSGNGNNFTVNGLMTVSPTSPTD